MRNPLKRKKALTGDSGVMGALQSGWQPIALLGGGSRERIQNIYNTAQSANYGWMYQNSEAVRTVIDLIVRNVGQLDLRLYEEVSEAERQPQPDHPAAMSLRYPNATTTRDSFIRSLFTDYLIYKNAYAWIAPADGEVISLYRIPSYMMEVQSESLFEVDNYRVWPQGAFVSNGSYGGGGMYRDFSPDDILHWRGEHPHDPRVGLSPLDTLRDVIAEDAALTQAIVELAQNGLQEPIWVKRPLEAPPLSPEASAAFEEDLMNRLRRRTKKPVVLEEGMEMQSFGMSPADAQMLEVRKWCLTRVATAYGVPLGMVGLDPNIDKAQEQFYTDTLPPYCKDFTSMLNQRVLVRVYDYQDGCFEFNLDEKQMGNDRLRALVAASGRPVMLTNEARAKVNLPPVDNGDELVTPLNVIVGENPKPSPQIQGPQSPTGPPQDGSYRLEQGSADTPPKALKRFEPLPQFHPTWAADMERQKRNIDKTQADVQRHFNRINRTLRLKAIGDDHWARLEREFAADLDSTLGQIVEVEGAIYAIKLGGYDFNASLTPNYVKAMAAGAAEAITDNIRKQVDDLGVDGAMALIPQHVQSAGASLGVHSTVWAREEAARQGPDGGRSRMKTWVADTERHADFAGDTVALGDDWPAGFAPGSAPNCKCTAAIF